MQDSGCSANRDLRRLGHRPGGGMGMQDSGPQGTPPGLSPAEEVLRGVLKELDAFDGYVLQVTASAREARVRIRAILMCSFTLHMYFHVIAGRYGFVLTKGNRILRRWDNAPHYPRVGLHHVHDEFGRVLPSNLVGDPVRDTRVVMEEVIRILRRECPLR